MSRLLASAVATAIAISVWVDCAGAANNEPLALESEIPLGNVRGRIDHLAVDLNRKRLFVAELGNNSVSVVDLNGGKAAITGDFLVTGDEVNPLIKTLRSNGIEVTAIHSHMLDEQPRMIFIHFWANDDALKLAKGLRAGLDKTAAGGKS